MAGENSTPEPPMREWLMKNNDGSKITGRRNRQGTGKLASWEDLGGWHCLGDRKPELQPLKMEEESR